MASARFLLLDRRIDKLQKRFIPRQFSPTASYTDRQRDHARAFRLLVHAEIEAYLEDRAKELVITAVRNFKSDGIPRTVVLNLVGFHSKTRELSTEKLQQIYGIGTSHLIEAVDNASAAYHYMLQNNHGVRQGDVLRLLLPIGFQTADIDATLLATLDSFGMNRGEIAHTSIKAQSLIDPQNEVKTVALILAGLDS